VKSPKYYWSDTGLAMWLAGEDTPRGEHLENVIVQDLLAWQGARVGRSDVMYWRTAKGYEVDLVVGDGRRVLPIEVKATSAPSTRDVAGMLVFLDEYSDRAPAGLILHTGDDTYWIARNVVAAPWWSVL
jgi:predicted AAA+ superfamily ATPase